MASNINPLYPLPRLGNPRGTPGVLGVASPGTTAGAVPPASPSTSAPGSITGGIDGLFHTVANLGRAIGSTDAGKTIGNTITPGIDAVASSLTPPNQNVTSTSAPPPPPITAYQSLLNQRLQGKDPDVINAQNQQNTNSSLNNYLALKTGQQEGVQGGFTPGTLQYQRGLDQTQATAAETNLQGQNAVNADARASSDTALQEQQTNDNNLISSISDPQAKQYLQGIQAKGGDVQAAYSTMFDSSGKLNPNYASPNPSQIQLQGFEQQEQAEHPDWPTSEVNAAAETDFQNAVKTTNQPNQDATDKQAAADLQTAINTGNYKSVNWSDPATLQAVGQAPVLSYAAADGAGGTKQYVDQNAGKLVSLNGSPYIVNGYSQIRTTSNTNLTGTTFNHTDIVQATDPKTGNPVWIDIKSGKVGTTPPPNNDATSNAAWLKTFK